MKNIVIIGHSSGIGKALTTLLADDHRVYGTFCTTSEHISHKNVATHYVNILEESPDFSFLPDTIDGLVYCPGAISLKPFARIKTDDFLIDYQLQVIGAVKTIQACLPGLKKSASPAIVLFSTVAVKTGFPFHSIVGTNKGAIEGLTKSLAAELAPTIRVNCIAPSLTDTRLTGHLLNTPEKKEANAQRHPLKKIGEANDIAQAAAFLLGNTSQWITGQIIAVDGGISTIKA